MQVARLLGAEVVAACGSEAKLEAARAMGAAEAVTYDALSTLQPVDVVFDLVGGELFQESLALLRPLGVAIGIGFAGGWWQPVDPALLVGRNIGVQGFYLGRLMRHRPDVVRVAATTSCACGSEGRFDPTLAPPSRSRRQQRRTASSRSGAPRARSSSSREGARDGRCLRDRRGHRRAAPVGRLRRRRPRPGNRLRRRRSSRWDAVGPVDVGCLNAGVLGGPSDPASLSIESYRRALSVNVDGVVLGVRRLAQVMPPGGRIVCTASLGGLTAMPDDPVYAATKHAVVGFVRSVAPTLRAVASRSTSCARASPTPRWCRVQRASASSRRASRCCARRTSPMRSGSLSVPARRATRGSCNRVGRRSTSASRTSPARAARTSGRSARHRHSPRRSGVAYGENDQPSPSAKLFRIRRATTMRCTSSGPS